jgi:hypothetical protein
MEKLTMDVKIKKDQERANEMEDVEKRKRDIERSSFIAKTRSELEMKHFQEKQAVRKLLTERASKELEIRASREVEIFIRDQKVIEDRECARKEEETRQHLELEKAVHKSREEQITLKQEQKKKAKELDYALAKQCHTQSIADLARENNNETERRKQNMEYKRLQKEQTLVSIQNRAKCRQIELEEATAVKRTLDAEDNLFREFAMKEMDRFQLQGKQTDLLKKVLKTC